MKNTKHADEKSAAVALAAVKNPVDNAAVLAAIKALADTLAPVIKIANDKLAKQNEAKQADNQLKAWGSELKVILDAIPDETKKALKVVKFNIDPKDHWFGLFRENGTRVGVKKLENNFRVRVRDSHGAKLSEAVTLLNGLNAALAEIASAVV